MGISMHARDPSKAAVPAWHRTGCRLGCNTCFPAPTPLGTLHAAPHSNRPDGGFCRVLHWLALDCCIQLIQGSPLHGSGQEDGGRDQAAGLAARRAVGTRARLQLPGASGCSACRRPPQTQARLEGYVSKEEGVEGDAQGPHVGRLAVECVPGARLGGCLGGGKRGGGPRRE